MPWDKPATYLDGVVCVFDKVDSDVEVDGGGNMRRKGSQAEDLDGAA